MLDIENNIEVYCQKFNEFRSKGGTYTTPQLAKALRGFPFSSAIPVVMRKNPNLSGYLIVKDGITFDTKHSIYKEGMLKILKEAREYIKECNSRNYIKTRNTEFLNKLNLEGQKTKLNIKKAVEKLCVSLFYQCQTKEVKKVMEDYKFYLKSC